MRELSYTLPNTREDHYAKGNYGEIYFEVPAIFNEDGTCDEPATIQKIQTDVVDWVAMRELADSMSSSV